MLNYTIMTTTKKKVKYVQHVIYGKAVAEELSIPEQSLGSV